MITLLASIHLCLFILMAIFGQLFRMRSNQYSLGNSQSANNRRHRPNCIVHIQTITSKCSESFSFTYLLPARIGVSLPGWFWRCGGRGKTAVLQYKQMHGGSFRKGSYDASSQSEDDPEHMFPRVVPANLQESLDLLRQNYNRNEHAFELSNFCFRCHLPQFVDSYQQFREANHPELQQPRISSLYDNSAFVDLPELGRRLQKENSEIPGPHIAPVPKQLPQMLGSLFAEYGYVPNLERFLLFYPTYLEKHLQVEKELFASSKIDSHIAYFLALAAAAEMGSAYVMARMVRKFLRAGGNLEWLREGSFPAKYRMILPLNRLMARAPWQIDDQLLQGILENGTVHWSKNELALCIQILAFAHQLSTIALAIGLEVEDPVTLQFLNLDKLVELKRDYDNKNYQSTGSQEKLAVMIPVIRELDEEREGAERGEFKEEIVMSKKMLKKTARRVENIDVYMKEIGNELTKQDMYRQINAWVAPLLPPYSPIEKRGEMRNNVLDYSEYNYKFMAYPILHNLTQTAADKLQNLIAYSEIMTRGNFGSEKLNHTKEFRRAVRYYAQNLCGYTHHEYDFKSNVGSFLTMALKFYVRLLTLSPVHISRQVIRETNHESGQIECFDLGHLAILIANTKMSLEMTLTIQAFEL